MNKIGTRQDGCIHFMFSGSRRKRLGTSISWKVVQKGSQPSQVKWPRRSCRPFAAKPQKLRSIISTSLLSFQLSRIQGEERETLPLSATVQWPQLSIRFYTTCRRKHSSKSSLATETRNIWRLPLHWDKMQWRHCQGRHLQGSVLWVSVADHGGGSVFKYVNMPSHMTDKSCRPRSHPAPLRCLVLLCFDL